MLLINVLTREGERVSRPRSQLTGSGGEQTFRPIHRADRPRPVPQGKLDSIGEQVADGAAPGACTEGFRLFQEARSMSRLLLISEIIRRLQLHQQHWGHITVIASMADVSCETIRKIMRDGRMSLRLQTVLSDILERLDCKEIVIKRNSPAIAKGNDVNKLRIEERPADAPHFQRRIVRASEYNRWARCIACGGTRFSGIKRTRSDGEKPRYYACGRP